MTITPSVFTRVPNRLANQLTQGGLSRANIALLTAQNQLLTNKRVARPSDDPVAAALVNVLDGRIDASDQRARNLKHGESVLGVIDNALEQIVETAQEAKTIASGNVGVGSDAQTRASQAVVVESLISSLFNSLNRDYAGLHVFGGERTGQRPVESFFGGYRYRGEGDGLYTDVGPGLGFPITLGADRAVGALSAKKGGTVDLSPTLTASTRIADLRGPKGQLTALGTVQVSIDDGTPPATSVDVDLSQATTMGDVATAIESAIRTADPAALGGVFPSSVGFAGERVNIGGIAAGYTITLNDGPTGETATALGMQGFSYTTATPVNGGGPLLNPALSDNTTLAALNPATALTYGDIVFRNGGRSGTVTTSAGMTVGELKEAVERLNLGVRIEIAASGDTLDVINEVSGSRLSVEEAGGTAASTLGLRTLDLSTPASVLNNGRGVRISDGNIRPDNGLPDTARNQDFRITLTSGATFDVDLRAQDMTSMSTMIAKINADAAAAGHGAVFTAALDPAGTGVRFSDTAAGPGALRVTSLNGAAAQDLGLLDATLSTGPTTTLTASNRATVRVDSMLSTLIELRDALRNNNESGITFAGERLETDLLSSLQARAEVGARASRIIDAQDRLVDTNLLDQSIKSDLQDLDYTKAYIRFTELQTQFQAGIQTAASIRSLSLLNFLS
jgi:flagellar hook-associated protein 3 FlgL